MTRLEIPDTVLNQRIWFDILFDVSVLQCTKKPSALTLSLLERHHWILFRITRVSNKFDNQYLFDQHLCFVKAYHQNLSNMQATRNSLLRIICKIRLFVLNNLQEFVFFATIEVKYFLVVLRCCWHETWMLTKGSSCVSCFWCSWHKVSQGISDE